MARFLLPVLAALLMGAAPASAQVVGGSTTDPAERPADPGRDIESITSTYDPAGTWTAHVRLYGAPTAETRALLRTYLGVRAPDGACQGSAPATLIAVWTGPQDRGGKGFVDNLSFDVAKSFDEDGRGFTVVFSEQRLAGRATCGLVTTTLSHDEPFDRVGAFGFAGAPTAPPPGQPSGPFQPGAPSEPGGDAAPPSAQMTFRHHRRAARKGIVRVSLLAASEPVLAAATLRGPARRVLSRGERPLGPRQMVTLNLRLGTPRCGA